MILSFLSPRLEDRGSLTADLESHMRQVASAVVERPGYVEHGRLSQRVALDENQKHDTGLHDLAIRISETYLGAPPAPGSVAVISTVTDAAAYRRHTQTVKAASYWHQDFALTDRGFFFPKKESTRLIIPMLAGPLCAVGQVSLGNVIQISATEPPHTPDRERALNAGITVVGADGVLIKSEIDPVGGTVLEAVPNRAYVVPHTSIHKSNPVLPEGRIFFQLDTFNA